MVKFVSSNASSTTWWPKLEPMLIALHVGQIWNQFWWHHLVVQFWTNASGILFSWRDNSSYRLYTLGPLCLCQCLKGGLFTLHIYYTYICSNTALPQVCFITWRWCICEDELWYLRYPIYQISLITWFVRMHYNICTHPGLAHKMLCTGDSPTNIEILNTEI